MAVSVCQATLGSSPVGDGARLERSADPVRRLLDSVEGLGPAAPSGLAAAVSSLRARHPAVDQVALLGCVAAGAAGVRLGHESVARLAKAATVWRVKVCKPAATAAAAAAGAADGSGDGDGVSMCERVVALAAALEDAGREAVVDAVAAAVEAELACSSETTANPLPEGMRRAPAPVANAMMYMDYCGAPLSSADIASLDALFHALVLPGEVLHGILPALSQGDQEGPPRYLDRGLTSRRVTQFHGLTAPQKRRLLLLARDEYYERREAWKGAKAEYVRTRRYMQLARHDLSHIRRHILTEWR